MPSSIFISLSISENANNNVAARSIIRSRRMTDREMGKVIMIAVIPSIRHTFAMLLPTTFPIDMLAEPSSAALMLTHNSGSDVPIETIVTPMISFETLKYSATRVLLSTTQSPAYTKSAMPATNAT